MVGMIQRANILSYLIIKLIIVYVLLTVLAKISSPRVDACALQIDDAVGAPKTAGDCGSGEGES